MSTRRVEANYIQCDVCAKSVPQSCIIFEKGGSLPELVNSEHKKHGIEICTACFRRMKILRKVKAA